MLGGVSWFAIPWAFGTVMGLSCRALTTNPKFPTYPYALTASQASSGLVAPAAAVTVLGTGGAIAVLLVVFMAATSATSAELISVSSIVTFDVFGFLWKPLRGRQAVGVTHVVIIVFAVWIGAWSTILDKVNINLGWLYYVQGVLLVPAVTPVALTVIWKKQSAAAAFFGTLLGTVCGLIGWFGASLPLLSLPPSCIDEAVGCWKVYGSINITNLALPYSAISGEAPGFVVSTVATIAISLLSEFQLSHGEPRLTDQSHLISTGRSPGTSPSSRMTPNSHFPLYLKTSPSTNPNSKADRPKSSRVRSSNALLGLLAAFAPSISTIKSPYLTRHKGRLYNASSSVPSGFPRHSPSSSVSSYLSRCLPLITFSPEGSSKSGSVSPLSGRWPLGPSACERLAYPAAVADECRLLPVWESRFEMLAIYRSVRRAASGKGL